jgi:hypothetical protein
MCARDVVVFPEAGTSLAAPLWAGLMALANEQAAAKGQPPVGFANPALYAIGKSARLFRVTAEDEANHYFAQVIEALRWLLMTGETACQVLEVDLGKAVSRQAGQSSSFFQNLQDLLGEMVEISENEDYILLADLMEYELLPTVREWQQILQNLSNS